MGTFYRTGQKFVVNNYNSLLALPKQFTLLLTKIKMVGLNLSYLRVVGN